MTDMQALAAFVVLVGFFAVLAGLVVFAAGMLNHLAYWWEDRHTEHEGHPEVVERCNVYSLRPRARALDDVRSRRGDAA